MKLNTLKIIGIAALVVIGAISIGLLATGASPGGGTSSSKNLNFGSYPVNYKLAYTSEFLRIPPTIKDLFGSNVKFKNSFGGVPATIKIESVSGTSDRLNIQILITANTPELKNIDMMRIQVTFEVNQLTQMSYVRNIKAASLISGIVEDKTSYGDAHSGAEAMGFFIGAYIEIGDISRFQPLF